MDVPETLRLERKLRHFTLLAYCHTCLIILNKTTEIASRKQCPKGILKEQKGVEFCTKLIPRKVHLNFSAILIMPVNFLQDNLFTSEMVFMHSGGARLGNFVSLSTTEVEFVAASQAAKKLSGYGDL